MEVILTTVAIILRIIIFDFNTKMVYQNYGSLWSLYPETVFMQRKCIQGGFTIKMYQNLSKLVEIILNWLNNHPELVT